jgi:hypothetical protein
MRFALPTLLFCAGLAGAAPVPDKPALPSGPAPSFVVVEARDGNFILTVQREVPVSKTRTVKVKIGNDVVDRTEVVTEMVMVLEKQMLNGASVKVFDVDGTLIPPADAAARLKEPTSVVLSADGKLVDPAYRALLNRKVLILVNTQGNGPVVPRPEPLAPPPPPRLQPPPGK